MENQVWVSRSAMVLALGLAMLWQPGLAKSAMASESLADLRGQLEVSVCSNNWSMAIQQANALIASPYISSQDRAELVSFRHRLQRYQQQGLTVDYISGCDAALAPLLTTVPTPTHPLQLDRALTLALGEPDLTPDQTARQIAARQRAGLNYRQPSLVPELSPSRLMDTAQGVGISAGAIGQGVEVFAFVGGQGDLVTIDLTVTRILAGLTYTDDDSQLYLFNSRGYLLAANDDFRGLQSRLANINLPNSGFYYIAVTTYNKTPLLSPAGQLVEWQNQGNSAIEYTLTVTGLTPSEQLALPPMP
jgi:hypothetical protein